MKNMSLFWMPPAKDYFPSSAMTVIKQTLQKDGYGVQVMKWFVVVAMFLLSVGNISAQEVKEMQEKPNYIKNNSEANTFVPATYHDKANFPLQVMEIDDYQYFGLNAPVSLPHIDEIQTSGDYQLRDFTLYGIGDRNIMTGLMDKQVAEVGILYHKNSLFFNFGLIANVYGFNPLSNLNASPIHNQFGIRGNLRYDFNENVSVTVYGQYVNNPFFHSMAAFPYIATSSFGGYFTLQNEKLGMDLGVNNYYDVFSHSWRSDPIVRPTYKIGKMKVGMDVGPLMKEGMLRLLHKKRSANPTILPSR